jgi:hemerythrin-like metal-binding protein
MRLSSRAASGSLEAKSYSCDKETDMPLIAWDQSYSVGVRRCDEEHQKLFSLLNGLHSAMSVGKGSSVIVPIVTELENYTKNHFSGEEALMERTKYPALAPHRSQHQKFVSQVAEFRSSLQKGQPVNTVDVLDFIRSWLSDHIRKTDQAYGPHLNTCGIK